MAWNLPPDRSGMGGVFGASQEGMPGNRLYSGVKDMRSVGIGESIEGALLPRDEQGAPKAPGFMDFLSKALMAIPGTGRPTGTIPNKPMFQANNYAEPPVAANAIPAHEVTRLQRQLGRMLPITSENEAAAMAVRAQIRKLDEVHDAAYWGRSQPQKPNPLTTDLDEMYGAPSPQERARLLGIKVVDPQQ